MGSPANGPYAIIAGDLTAFAKYVFTGYEVSWHHEEIISMLERVSRKEIKRVALSVPPRRGKSQICSVLYPLWVMANNPDTKIIVVSYAAEKAESYSREARELARSPQFQRLFPNLQIAKDTSSVTHWKFEGARGYFHAVGAGGPITGFGADLVIIDDPISNREQAESAVEREKLWDWFTSVAITRKDTLDTAVVVIHTRWNEDDLIGRLKERHPTRWMYLNIPAVDEETGRIVWPERFTRESYDEDKEEMGERDWYALMQGQPYPPKGNIFDANWFVISPRHPYGLKWYRCWDLANTKQTAGSHTVGALIALDEKNHLWIRDMVRGNWKWHEARKHILSVAHSDGPEVTVLIEKGAFQFAKFAQDIVDEWEDLTIPAHAVTVKGLGDKEARAQPWAALAERGGVTLVGSHTTPWIVGFLQRIPSFSNSAPFTDEGDAVSLGFNEILRRNPRKPNDSTQHKPLSPAWAQARVEEQAALANAIFPDAGNYIFEP